MTAVSYHTVLGTPDADLLEEIAALSDILFDGAKLDHAWRLGRMPDVSVFLARQGGQLIAFKAGYAIGEGRYYSWLGGVHPAFRNAGVAHELTCRQHDWLRSQGFSVVETSSRSENPVMARVNSKNGFSIVGTKQQPHGLQILWSKTL